MPKVKSAFFDFVRHVVNGDIEEVSRRLATSPSFATASSDVGATRQDAVQLGKNIFQCFKAECGAQGNVLDLWAAVHQLPLYDAALHLAATFHLPRNREEEPVLVCKQPAAKTGSPGTVITSNGD